MGMPTVLDTVGLFWARANAVLVCIWPGISQLDLDYSGIRCQNAAKTEGPARTPGAVPEPRRRAQETHRGGAVRHRRMAACVRGGSVLSIWSYSPISRHP